jgi:hypothetical protein
MASDSTLVSARLRNQKLTRTALRTPEDVVAWLGAVQAQEYPGARWALGQRAKGLTDAAVEEAFDAGRILRTHVMRPTWHFVTPADIRWLLTLTAPRVHAVSAYYYRRLELDATVLRRSRAIFERALGDGTFLTRTELAAALAGGGIEAKGQRLAAVVMHAELERVICSGPKRGKQFTYALLDERAPRARTLDREESLAELAGRYFTSHGPATLRDFVWWSGLTVREAKVGVESAVPALVRVANGERTYYAAASRSAPPPAAPTAHLVPTYDEYLIAYKDREFAHATAATSAGGDPIDIYAQFLIVDGRFAGTWRPYADTDTCVVPIVASHPLTALNRRSIAEAAERYAQFLGVPVELEWADRGTTKPSRTTRPSSMGSSHSRSREVKR